MNFNITGLGLFIATTIFAVKSLRSKILEIAIRQIKAANENFQGGINPLNLSHRTLKPAQLSIEENSDPILSSWRESSQPNEQEAYQRIYSYIDLKKTSSSSTPLDLSNLDLTILPKCLFTNPIFSRANLAGNPLKEFPPELTIESVQNLENFEYVKKVIDSKDLQVKPTTLESELPQTELDITKTVDFRDFRRPNEFGITAYRHVFKMDEPGLLVSTGTERSFYGLIQAVLASPPNYCQGLIIRDINPKVKAYVDFNVLLLRLATNVTEYKELSHSCFPSLEECHKIWKLSASEQLVAQTKHLNDSIANRLKIVKSKLDADMTMDPTIKNYYLDNL
ncbi:MAG: hypothetical protein JSS09_03870, partial [Verrucomicrobia bacterium]|nr:hypothetical protein [Verrucomicrobiota bacterium]